MRNVSRPRWVAGSPWRRGAVVAAGIGLLVVVGRDGSPVWQVARGALAVLWTVGMVWAIGDDRNARRGVVAFVGGVMAAATGIGLAVPHLAKAGVTALSVAGLALIVGGVVLGFHGAAVLVRRAGRRTRLVLVPALGAVALLGIWCLGIAVAATNVPRTAVGDRAPGTADLAFSDVTFETDDGTTLSGWWIPSRNGAALVLLHGAGSTRSGVLDHAVLLARHGYGALLYDARGHGRSGGRAMDMGWFGDADLAAAVSFVARQPDVSDGRIAAVGMSMGGEEAVGAIASDHRIRAVVAEGATGRTVADKGWLSEAHGWRGSVQEGIDHLLYGAMDLLTSSHPPIALRDAVARAAPRPVLLVAAGTVPEEADAGRFIQAGSPSTVELWVVPDAGHTGALRTNGDEWERRVLAFLADALGPTVGSPIAAVP